MAIGIAPEYLPHPDVERVIAGCGVVGVGIRDRAILLVLARLALRSGDVRSLQLADIDWQRGCMVVSGKTRREVGLPLPQDVGDAVLAYIRLGRPRVTSPYVFLGAVPPFGQLRSSAITGVVRRAILRAGVKSPCHGARVLRHSAATEMLRRGATLDQIRVVLRHASPETTLIYAKVDIAALKAISQPWPEVVTC